VQEKILRTAGVVEVGLQDRWGAGLPLFMGVPIFILSSVNSFSFSLSFPPIPFLRSLRSFGGDFGWGYCGTPCG